MISFFRRAVSFLAPCFKAGGPGLAGMHSEHHFVCSGQAENPMLLSGTSHHTFADSFFNTEVVKYFSRW